MWAVQYHRSGGPEVLRVEEIAAPSPRDGQVLVRTLASGVSRIKTGERRLSFKEFCTLIALPSSAQPQGLALAPAKAIIITPELFRALRDLARDSLNMMSEDGAL